MLRERSRGEDDGSILPEIGAILRLQARSLGHVGAALLGLLAHLAPLELAALEQVVARLQRRMRHGQLLTRR